MSAEADFIAELVSSAWKVAQIDDPTERDGYIAEVEAVIQEQAIGIADAAAVSATFREHVARFRGDATPLNLSD